MKVPANFKADLDVNDVIVGIDPREQNPWPLTPLRTISQTYQTADYHLAAAPDFCAIERKSLEDLIQCCTNERPRFSRELERLRAFPIRFLIIESNWQTIEKGEWRSRTTPSVIIASLLSFASDGLPFVLADDHQRASQFAARILFQAARKKWREARAFAAAITSGEFAPPAELGVLT
jgi:ERCC4-type nuclease